MCCSHELTEKDIKPGVPLSAYLDSIKGMQFFDPHVHMTSRTTDDYQAMAAAGVAALIEPAFWLGQPRTGVATFRDYYSSLIGWERFRSSQFGIKHYCTIGLNSREANNEELAEQVMENLGQTLRQLSPETFNEVVALLGDRNRSVHIVGGRITRSLAAGSVAVWL